MAAAGNDMANERQWAASREPPLLGETAAMRQVRELVARAALCEAPVLLQGESGTGKEVAARLIHRRSARAGAPFVRLNCAAIPTELLESELFGYEAGAFTGAVRRKLGQFELAERGTLMLDEIGDMSPGLQAKLLHILQDGEFSRLGGEHSQRARTRILAASNVELEQAVAEMRFRPDLFYRLNVLLVRLPPLRQRREDIPLLVAHLLDKHGCGWGWDGLGAEIRAALLRYDWPGNVRELENVVQRVVILGDQRQALEALRDGVAEAADGPQRAGAGRGWEPAAAVGVDFGTGLVAIGKQAAWEAERRAILAALEQTRWNRRQAARLLQVSYKALHNKLRALKREAEAGAPGGERIGMRRMAPAGERGATVARRASA